MRTRAFVLLLSLLLHVGTCVRCVIAQEQPAAQQPSTSPDPQSVSKLGLLPVYGVDFPEGADWIDGAGFPSQSADFPNSGANKYFQQIWDALKPDGFTVLRIAFDVSDPVATGHKIANLCLWARANNVRLMPVLRTNDSGSNAAANFASNSSKVVQTLIADLRGSGDNSYLDAYPQLLAYQVENEINQPALHGGMSAAAVGDWVRSAAQAVRKTESEALSGTGIYSTPIAASASFDYELVKLHAIAGTALGDDILAQAYGTLKQSLANVVNASDIDLVVVDWYPGSISAGDAGKLSTLTAALIADAPGKQVLLSTGFSAAFRAPEQQQQAYTLAFANLTDYRASAGADSPFMGLLVRGALNGKSEDPPRPGLPNEMATWNWSAKADEVVKTWSGEKKSTDMTWWLRTVEANMGLLALQTGADGTTDVTAQPLQRVLTEIATAVSESSNLAQSSTAPGATPGTPGEQAANASAGASQGAQTSVAAPGSEAAASNAAASGFTASTQGQQAVGPTTGSEKSPSAFQSQLQQRLLSTLDIVFQRLAENLLSKSQGTTQQATAGSTYGTTTPGTSSTTPGTSGTTPGTAAVVLRKQDVSMQPLSPRAGEPITITASVLNQGAVVPGAALYAVGNEYLLAQSQTQDLPSGTSSLSLQWQPSDPSPAYTLTLKVGDGYGYEIASVDLDPVAIAAPAAPANAPLAPTSAGGTSLVGNSLVDTSAGGPGGTTAAGSISGTTGTPKITFSIGSAQFASLHIGALNQAIVANRPSSASVSLHNPYRVPLRNLKATLLVDGKAVQTQPMSVLMPNQTRSAVFPNLMFDRPGQHELKIVVESSLPNPLSAGGGPKPISGAVTARVPVVAEGLTRIRAIGGNVPAGESKTAKPLIAAPVGSQPSKPIRSLLPPMLAQRGTIAPAKPAVPAPAPALAATARPRPPLLIPPTSAPPTPPAGPNAPSPSAGTRALAGVPGKPATLIPRIAAPIKPNLHLTQSGVGHDPVSLTVGQPVTFWVVITNIGAADAKKAEVRLFIPGGDSNALHVTVAVPAKGSYKAQWRTKVPAGAFQLVASAAVADDIDVSDNQVTIKLSAAPAKPLNTLPPRRTIRIAPPR